MRRGFSADGVEKYVPEWNMDRVSGEKWRMVVCVEVGWADVSLKGRDRGFNWFGVD
jgi:hypothetical protein